MIPPDGTISRREEAGVPPHLRGLVSRLLVVGLAVACGCFLIGVAGYLDHGVGFGGGGTLPRPLASLPGAMARGDSSAFVFLGLLVLLATPVLRVVVSAGLFASVGDRPFTGLTLFVLTVLVATILVGVLR